MQLVPFDFTVECHSHVGRGFFLTRLLPKVTAEHLIGAGAEWVEPVTVCLAPDLYLISLILDECMSRHMSLCYS